jgi:hypothetical protein
MPFGTVTPSPIQVLWEGLLANRSMIPLLVPTDVGIGKCPPQGTATGSLSLTGLFDFRVISRSAHQLTLMD